MKALKAVVVIMGVLIVAGVALIVVTLAKRMAPEPPATAAAPARTPDRQQAFGEIAARLPPGYAPVEMIAEGDRLMVRLAAEGEDSRILVIDLRTGSLLGTVVLERQLAPARP